MKHLILITIVTLLSTITQAKCPDLQGNYTCNRAGMKNGHFDLTVSQQVIDDVTNYTFDINDGTNVNTYEANGIPQVEETDDAFELKTIKCEDGKLFGEESEVAKNKSFKTEILWNWAGSRRGRLTHNIAIYHTKGPDGDRTPIMSATDKCRKR